MHMYGTRLFLRQVYTSWAYTCMPEVFVSDIHVRTDNYRLAIHTKTQDIAFHYCTCIVTCYQWFTLSNTLHFVTHAWHTMALSIQVLTVISIHVLQRLHTHYILDNLSSSLTQHAHVYKCLHD